MDELDKLLSGLSHKKAESRGASVIVSNSSQPRPESTASEVNFDELDRLMNEFSSILTQSQGKSQIISQPNSSPVPSSSAFNGPSISISSSKNPAPSIVAAASVLKPNQNSVAYGIKFEDLKLGNQIGKGNFGVVYRGVYKGKTVAIKELFDTEDTNIEKYYQREIEMLSSSRHPNIVEFLGASKDKSGKTYIITEFCEGEDLKKVNKAINMPWRKRLEIALGVAKAVAYLHGKGIIHRDLKSDNILLTNNGTPKVIDFGFARPTESEKKKQMTMCGTDWTMAPEILLCMDYTKSVDVFSFGMILAELLSRIEADATHFKRVIPGFGIDPREIRSFANSGAPSELVELCVKCTSDDASSRPTFTDIIQVIDILLKKEIEKEEDNEEDAHDLRPDSVTIIKRSLDISPSPETASVSDAFNRASDAITENIEDVFIRRKRTLVNSVEKFIYAVENKRPYDVSLSIEISGENCKILPVGTSRPITSKMVEGIIPTGAQTVFATVDPINPTASISFKASMSVERNDVEVRCSEMEGVFLTTQISFGRISEITFEAYNRRKDSDVEVEVLVEGDLLEGSVNPICSLVRKKEKKVIGRVFSEDSVSSSWRWKPVLTYPDEVSNSNGVKLIRKHAGGRKFDFEVENTRDKPVKAEITFTGEGAVALKENPVVSRIIPGATELMASVELKGQTGMSWKWNES